MIASDIFGCGVLFVVADLYNYKKTNVYKKIQCKISNTVNGFSFFIQLLYGIVND